MAIPRSKQRRHHMRVQARWPVACQQIGRNGIAGEPFPAETLNLSAGGIGVVSEQPLFRPIASRCGWTWVSSTWSSAAR